MTDSEGSKQMDQCISAYCGIVLYDIYLASVIASLQYVCNVWATVIFSILAEDLKPCIDFNHIGKLDFLPPLSV